MKRLIAYSLALILACSLAACNKTEPPAVSDEPAPWNGLKNTETGAVITLGMTQEEVEALLGEGTYYDRMALIAEQSEQEGYTLVDPADTDQMENYAYGEGENFLVVNYRDGSAVTMITVEGVLGVLPGATNWVDQYGISYGTSRAAMIEQRGEGEVTPFITEPDAEGKTYSFVRYGFDSDGQQMEGEEAPYTVMFLLGVDENGEELVYATWVYGSSVSPADGES